MQKLMLELRSIKCAIALYLKKPFLLRLLLPMLEGGCFTGKEGTDIQGILSR